MNIEERLALNKQKVNGIVTRIQTIDVEKEALLQEALRLDGENRILNEQVASKEKKKGETKP
jgi:hypothetical protein